MELFLASASVAAAVFVLIILILQYTAKNRLLFQQRIKAFSLQEKAENVIQEELSIPLRERMTRPLGRVVKALPKRALSAVTLEGLTRKLMLAGNPGNLSAAEFAALRFCLMLLFPVIVFLAALFSGIPLLKMSIFLLSAGTLGYFIPDLFLRFKRVSRQDEIKKELPDVLDLLTVSVEAGLGFDAAIAKVVEKMEGAFPRELGRVLQEIKMGKPRRQALKDLGCRVGVDEVNNFVSAVIQADQLGVSMGNVMRLQSRESREKRRRDAQERAMKAPVKMVVPLVLFIFPTIFIVLMGPAVLQILDSFIK